MAALARKLAFLSSFSLLFLFIVAGGARAQTSALEGHVIGEDGKPLKGALIRIERTDVRGNYKVKTDKKGRYFHAGLPLGTYSVSCEVDGKVWDTVAGVRTTLGEGKNVDFNLQKVRARQKALQAAAASGTLTEDQTKGLSDEQKKVLQEQMAKRSKAMKKNKELNDAFNAAMAAKEAKQWDVAVQNLEKAGELDPEQIVVWAQLADTYVQKSMSVTGAARGEALNKGIEAYEKVLALKPEDPAYHNNYALALARAGKMDEAEVELEKAAQLNPTGAGKYYYNLGAVMINTGNQEAAGMAFKKAIEADPNYANAYFQYGMYLLAKASLGDDGSIKPVEGTVEALQKYLEIEPNGPFAPSAQGAIQSLQGSVETSYTNPESRKKRKKKK